MTHIASSPARLDIEGPELSVLATIPWDKVIQFWAASQQEVANIIISGIARATASVLTSGKEKKICY